jgi:hypothetical protein
MPDQFITAKKLNLHLIIFEKRLLSTAYNAGAVANLEVVGRCSLIVSSLPAELWVVRSNPAKE